EVGSIRRRGDVDFFDDAGGRMIELHIRGGRSIADAERIGRMRSGRVSSQCHRGSRGNRQDRVIFGPDLDAEPDPRGARLKRGTDAGIVAPWIPGQSALTVVQLVPAVSGNVFDAAVGPPEVAITRETKATPGLLVPFSVKEASSE